MMVLRGKNAIVTGSTSGIGLGIAQTLAQAGVNVMLNGLGDPKETEAQRARLEKDHGVKVLFSPANMLDEQAIVGMVKAACAAFGTVDILMLALSASSKFNAEWPFLTYLRDIGREATSRWLDENFERIGNESSTDIRTLFEGSET
jgi:NAD(P)-dependent dehydrogenase (short-subunit alcohol dehydrogenase family)